MNVFKNACLERSRKAFTLIELLIVIAVIGILAGIVVFSVTGAQKKSRDNTRKTDIEQIKSALEMYKQANGAYPESGCSDNSAGCYSPGGSVYYIVIQGSNTSGTSGSTVFKSAISKYLSPVPTDPTNTNDYRYLYFKGSAGGYYLLSKKLESGNGGNFGLNTCYGYHGFANGNVVPIDVSLFPGTCSQ